MIVRVVVGGYLVSPRRGGLPCFVGKDKSCTCGDETCEHVKAVTRHLKQGGQRAPECAQPVADTSVCPV